MKSEKLKDVQERVAALKDARTSDESRWRDISEFIVPNRGRFYSSGDRGGTDAKRGSRIVDGTATRAVRILASGMQGGLTSPARPWFRLTLEDKSLMEFGPVRVWLDSVERAIRNALARTGFYQAIHSMYLNLGAFGTSCIFHEEDKDDVMRFTGLAVGEYFWAVDRRGQVDTLAWDTKRSVRELAQRYGEERLSKGARKLLKEAPYTFVDVVHFVCPRAEPEAQIGPRSMAFACLVYEKAADAEDILYEGGYEEFPFLCARWDCEGSDVYGTGPGHEVLADVKLLQEMAKSQLLAVHKVLNPPMRVPTGYKQRLNLIPGAQNFVNPQSADALAPLYQIDPDIQAVSYKIEDVRKAIREGFFNDLFLMFAGDDRSNVTAAEIMQRQGEKMLMLGPVVERYQTEILDPLISRSYAILARAGKVAQPPQELDGMDAMPEFTSILAQAQKVQSAQAIRALSQDVGMLAQFDPAVRHKLDAAQALDELHAVSGAPADILRSDDEYAARVQADQKAAQQAKAQEQMLAGVDAAQKLGKVPVNESSNAFEQLMQQAAGNGGMAQ